MSGAPAGGRRFDYVGWSWGGSIGVHVAAGHADWLTALVLLDAGHTDVQDVMEWTGSSLEDRIADYEANAISSRPGATPSLSRASGRPTGGPPSKSDCARAWRSGMAGSSFVGTLLPRRPRCTGSESSARAHSWRASESSSYRSLLVVATRNDTSAQVARFRTAVPRAAVIDVDSEHDLLAQAPQETARIVADWLLEQTAQPKVA